MHRYYTTRQIKKGRKNTRIIDLLGGRANAIAMVIFFVLSLTVGMVWIEIEARKAEADQYIASWLITTNQHIEWTWAGKETGK